MARKHKSKNRSAQRGSGISKLKFENENLKMKSMGRKHKNKNSSAQLDSGMSKLRNPLSPLSPLACGMRV